MAAAPVPLSVPDDSLFARLRGGAGEAWGAYVHHDFVAALADGSLDPACFRHYLIQDYHFLIRFARAYGLLVTKLDDLVAMRRAGDTMQMILNDEMRLHVEWCAARGIDEAEMLATPPAAGMSAYTAFVMETGLRGDALDLFVALAPCVVGYAEIGARLAADPATRMDGNDYARWIETYSGAEFVQAANAEILALDDVWRARGNEARLDGLQQIFTTATRLEAGFFQMGLDQSL